MVVEPLQGSIKIGGPAEPPAAPAGTKVSPLQGLAQSILKPRRGDILSYLLAKPEVQKGNP